MLREEPTGKHTFTNDSDAPNAMPLSLSMPRKAEPWRGDPIEAYIDGILPDDPAIRQRIGRLYGVNPRNPFALLTAVGLDCGGGVQFVVPDTPNTENDTNNADKTLPPAGRITPISEGCRCPLHEPIIGCSEECRQSSASAGIESLTTLLSPPL